MQQPPRRPNQILADSIGEGSWPMTLRWKIDTIETPRQWIAALRSWVSVCQREPEGLPVRYYEVLPAVEQAIRTIEREWAHDLDHGYDPDYQPFTVSYREPRDTPE